MEDHEEHGVASTEEKIKAAARKVFTQKGYAAARTRDIAEESGYNLALINYYFRSKEKLFELVMLENVQTFIHSISGILNDTETTLEEKLNLLVGHYIDMLKKNPDLPIFVLSTIHSNPDTLSAQFPALHKNAYMVKQLKEWVAVNRPGMHPLHLVLNVISMTIFPFIASPLIRSRTGMNKEEFEQLMEERKTLIPGWIKAIMNTNI